MKSPVLLFSAFPCGPSSRLALPFRLRSHKLVRMAGFEPARSLRRLVPSEGGFQVTFLHPDMLTKLAPSDGTAPPLSASKAALLLLQHEGILKNMLYYTSVTGRSKWSRPCLLSITRMGVTFTNIFSFNIIHAENHRFD